MSLRLLPLSALESGDVKTAAMKVADTEGMETVFCHNTVLEDLYSRALLPLLINRGISVHVW